MIILEQGTLWNRVVKTTEQARSKNALLPIPTHYTFIEDAGIRFFVRILAGLRLKDEARKQQKTAQGTGKVANPFLPPEKELTVADITDTHIAVLNKFNVVDHHLLIITREFEDQETLLTRADFEALWACMAEYEALGFYNGGAAGGASQQHKHLQMVPLPLAPECSSVPVEPLFSKACFDKHAFAIVPAFPFRHAFVQLAYGLWEEPQKAAELTYELYGNMLGKLGMSHPSGEQKAMLQHPHRLTHQSGPYCLLVTRRWMLLIPRSREHFENISLNSLAYAGSFFVRDEHQLLRLKEFGPMNALKYTGIPI